jgi:hypothetical protein
VALVPFPPHKFMRPLCSYYRLLRNEMYEVGVPSNELHTTFIQIFVKIGQVIQNLKGGKHRHHGDLKKIAFFFFLFIWILYQHHLRIFAIHVDTRSNENNGNRDHCSNTAATIETEITVETLYPNNWNKAIIDSQQWLRSHYCNNGLRHHCWLCYSFRVRVI